MISSVRWIIDRHAAELNAMEGRNHPKCSLLGEQKLVRRLGRHLKLRKSHLQHECEAVLSRAVLAWLSQRTGPTLLTLSHARRFFRVLLALLLLEIVQAGFFFSVATATLIWSTVSPAWLTMFVAAPLDMR